MAAEGARRSYGSDARVAGLQRGRLLDAMFALVHELGYANVTAHKISERAGVSSRTFYELFCDREDCFYAAFEYSLEALAEAASPTLDAERDWVERVRAGLAVLLEVLDREPAMRRLVFVEALTAGPRVLERRARALAELAVSIDEGRKDVLVPAGLPALTAEATVGATFGVIHARLLQDERTPIAGLLNALMATIVLPFRGAEAAMRELERPLPDPAIDGPLGAGVPARRPLGSSSPVDFRLTIRTQLAISAVAELSARGSHPNNREVSEHMGLHDQGQVSRLMGRMQAQGLVENTRAQTAARGRGLAKAWRLTPHGQTILDAHRGGKDLLEVQGGGGTGSKLAAKRRHGGKNDTAAADVELVSIPFRLTALTHQVLHVLANPSEPGSGLSNREIARAAEVNDEGQISKLLARLQTHGLLENTGGASSAAGNAWRLTSRGEELLRASNPLNTANEETK
jgi:AcrR family transcriptional regulator